MEELYQHPYQVERATRDINTNCARIHSYIKNIVFEENLDEDQVMEIVSIIEGLERNTLDLFNVIYDSYPGEKSHIDSAYKVFMDWKALRDGLISLRQQNLRSDLNTNYRTVNQPYVEKLFGTMAVMTNFQSQQASNFYTAAMKQSKLLTTRLMILVLLIISIILIINYVFLRQIYVPLKGLTAAAERYRSGEYETDYIYKSRNEFGLLSVAFQKMASFFRQEVSLKERTAEDAIIRMKEVEVLIEERTRKLQEEMEERKRTEIILRESEERFRAVFEKSEMGIVLVSESMKYMKANPAFCDMTGYTEEELISLSVGDLTLKEDYPDSIANARDLWAGKISKYRDEKRYIHKSGRIIWAFIAVTVVRDASDKPMFYLTMINNITDRKLAEDKLAREQVLLTTLINNLPQTIHVKDLQKRRILANRADLELIGKNEKEVIGKTDRELFPAELAEGYMKDDDYVLTNQKSIIDREEQIVNEKGKPLWFLVSKIPLTDHTGKITGIVGIGHNITARKKVEDQLRYNEVRLKMQNEEIRRINRDLIQAKEKAEESDRLKTAFLHNISHEIRTPLNAIIGFTSVLASENLPSQKRQEFMDIIYKSNDQLLSIISSILTLANLESGQETFNAKETDINQMLLDVYEQFSITKVPNEVSLSYSEGLPDEKALILTDSVKLMQILVNLVGNALKFTHKGFVRFGYSLNKYQLDFFVEDSGIGIPENMHSRIFERFSQVDSTITRKYGGTGLGLAISKGYARLLGGNISVTSTPGKGSKFVLSIPYNPVNKAPEPGGFNSLSDIGIHGIVLIAEDEHVNFLLLKEILSGYEVQVYRAENGQEALNFCSGQIKPDVVLMDMKMPVMDGIEATDKIKKIVPALPVIALSAYTSEDDKKRFFEAGCDSFIEKPFRRDELLRILEHHLSRKHQ